MGNTIEIETARYLDHLTVERGLSANTIGAYRRDLARYRRFLEARDITEPGQVDEATVRSFLAALSASTYGEDERPYRATSVARSLSSVRSFHRFLVREGVTGRDLPRASRSRSCRARCPHPLTVDEVDRLDGRTRPRHANGLRDRAILELLYGSGLRVSELTGLDVDDVDLEGGSVRVLGKGGKEREVPLGRFGREAVGAYLTQARPSLARGGGRGALFLNQRGGRLSRQSCDRMVRAAAGPRLSTGTSRTPPSFLRHPPARRRDERACRAGAAGT